MCKIKEKKTPEWAAYFLNMRQPDNFTVSLHWNAKINKWIENKTTPQIIVNHLVLLSPKQWYGYPVNSPRVELDSKAIDSLV